MSLILDGSTGVSDVDGSAATPAIRGTDANTGMFFPAADTIAFSEGGVESMRLDSSGNFGLGTSPTVRLDVLAAGSGDVARFGVPASSRIINFYRDSVNFAVTDASGVSGNGMFGITTTNNLAFLTNSSERMRIDSAGNVGMGVSALGTSRLQVTRLNSSTSQTVALINNTYNNFDANPTVAYPLLILARDGKDATTYSSEVAFGVSRYENSGLNARTQLDIRLAQGSSIDTTVMSLRGDGNVGIGTSSPSQRLDIVTGSGFSATRFSNGTTTAICGVSNTNTGYLSTESNHPFVFVTNGTERMRIDSSGNLLVTGGNTSTSVAASIGMRALQTGFWGVTMSATTNATDTLNVYSTGASNYRFYVGMAGTVFATSTTISAISDVRLKENIQDIDVGLDKVMALKPRKFDWKEGKGKDKKGDRGWIAQEFEQVFPEMINEWKDPAPEGEEPYKAVNADLIPVLVKAIQEQQTLIENLTTRLNALEGN